MEVDEVLYRLGILSKSLGYKLVLHAVNLLLLCENWTPSLKELQREVAKFTPAPTRRLSRILAASFRTRGTTRPPRVLKRNCVYRAGQQAHGSAIYRYCL